MFRLGWVRVVSGWIRVVSGWAQVVSGWVRVVSGRFWLGSGGFGSFRVVSGSINNECPDVKREICGSTFRKTFSDITFCHLGNLKNIQLIQKDPNILKFCCL